MEEKEWLNKLKPGDKVYLDRGYNGHSVESVSRITATQIVIKINDRYEIRFRIKDGFEVGGDSWHHSILRELTPRLIDKIRMENKVRKMNELKNGLITPDNESELDALIEVLNKYQKSLDTQPVME